MEALNLLISNLNEIKRYNEVKNIIKNWVVVFDAQYLNEPFICFKYTLEICNFNEYREIKIKNLNRDYKHFKEIMDVEYPEKRSLNKIVSEYNKLFAKYGNIYIESLVDDMIYKINRAIENN